MSDETTQGGEAPDAIRPGSEAEAAAATPKHGIGLVAVAIMCVHFLARIGGFLVKRVLSHFFGTSDMADAATGVEKIFQAVYYVPEELLTHSLLPVFNRVRKEESEEDAWRMASLTGTIQALLLVLVTVLCMAYAKPLVNLVLGVEVGKDADLLKAQAKFDLTVRLVRVAMLGLFCTSLGSLTYVILNAYKRFVSPAMGDVAQKLGIIVGTVVVCVGFRELGPMGYAIGFIVGGVFKLLTHLIALGPKLRLVKPGFDFANPRLRELGWLMLPLLAGSLISKARDLAEAKIAWIASASVEGTLASLDYARKIVWMPVNTLPYALGIALFPFLADWALRGERKQVTGAFLTSSRMMFFIFLPMTVAFIVLGKAIIVFLYKGGRFDEASVALTAAAFRVYSLGLIFYALEIIALQVFYAHRDTKTPFWLGLGASAIQITLAYGLGILAGLGNVGIAFGFAAAKTVKVGWMWYALRDRLTGFDWSGWAKLFGKCLLACLLMAAWMEVAKRVAPHFLNINKGRGAFLFLGGTTSIGAALYLGAAYLMRIEELDILMARVRGKLRRGKPVAA